MILHVLVPVTTMKFETMSNELVLCVWDYLSKADTIFSFSDLNDRLTQLLFQFCHMHKELSLRHASLSACRFFSRQIPRTNEWCLGIQILELGNRHRCGQLEMFANEVFTVQVQNHFTRLGRPCPTITPDHLPVLLMHKKSGPPLFPQLTKMIVWQATTMSDHCRSILLNLVARSTCMKNLIWSSDRLQVHHSRALFDWLFRPSLTHANAIDLQRCQLKSVSCSLGFELIYEHTIIAGYRPHLSLTFLYIDVLNWKTLRVLLHYLPALKQLGEEGGKNLTSVQLPY